MTLPVSPPLTLGQVLAELQLANPGRTAPVSLGDADVRVLAQVGASGAYNMSALLGKSSSTPFTITGFTPASPAFKGRVGSGVSGVSVTVNTINGVGPFTYSWSVLANTAGGGFANGSTAKAVNFNTAFRTAPNTAETTLRVVVTDTGNANRVQIDDFTVEWEWL